MSNNRVCTHNTALLESLHNNSIEKLSLRYCLCGVIQFSIGEGGHESVDGGRGSTAGERVRDHSTIIGNTNTVHVL